MLAGTGLQITLKMNAPLAFHGITYKNQSHENRYLELAALRSLHSLVERVNVR